MALFKRKKEPEVAASAVQLRRGGCHPFAPLGSYVPLGKGEIRLYRAIREAVPVVDAAILKIIRLTGGFTVRCSDKGIEKQFQDFLENVDIGHGQRGMDAFLAMYLDSMITCGRAVGEVVLSPGARDIAAVICGNVADIEIMEGQTPLDFKICPAGVAAQPLPRQDLLLFTAFNPEPDSPYGVSLMRSMPFLTDVLLKIYSATGTNFERMGNVRFAVTYKPSADTLDKDQAAARGELIAREWASAMQESKNGGVKDFVAVGDVSIKAIGADNQVLDTEVPVRQILEQLIARTGIPPFMLGLNWSTTERMSSQQADLMTSELWAIRRSLTPMLRRICDLWLRVHGCTADYELQWDEINLQDQVEMARARLYSAQAQQLEPEE